MMLISVMVCFLFGHGLYSVLCAYTDVPSKKASKLMLMTKKQTGSGDLKLFDVYVSKVSKIFAPIIKIDGMKKKRIQSALLLAEIKMSPEEYLMKAYLTALLTALMAIPFFMIMPMVGFVVVGLSVVMWFATYNQAFDFVKKKKKKMELELPKFTMSIAQSIKTDRDVLKILTTYRKIAGADFGRELDITIADMKTGNYENALLKFENRIGSNMLSDIVRGLIGTLRGDDQTIYFEMLRHDMRQIEQNNLKKEAAKRPKKMQKYSMMMLLCILLIYIVVLTLEIIGSMGTLF